MKKPLDHLEDPDPSMQSYKLASHTKRIFNFLIDGVAYSLLFGGGIKFLAAIFLPLTSNYSLLLAIIVLSPPYFLYYLILEWLLRGKTIGKFFTNTRAISVTNRKMDFQTTLLRSICRLIPLESLSFLGPKAIGWHDSLSKTKVIVDEEWVQWQRRLNS